MKKVVFYALAASLMLATLLSSASSATQYQLVDLGYGEARAVNNFGQAVGSNGHAFLWDAAGGMRDLGTLGGRSSSAYGINDSGQVVGTSYDASNQLHAFIWDAVGGMRDLGTLEGFLSGVAYGINGTGQVVGAFSAPGVASQAFVADASDEMSDIGTPGFDSCAWDVNRAGQVVGHNSNTTTGNSHAFIWDASGGTRDLGTLQGGLYSDARGINEDGIAAGWSLNDYDNMQAVTWDAGGVIHNLGTLPGCQESYAYDINDSGDVVGDAYDMLTGRIHAFAWDPTDGMTELTMLGGHDTQAYGINYAGQIVGTSIDASGKVHAVLWDPVNTPEPSSILALIGGFAGLGRMILRKKR